MRHGNGTRKCTVRRATVSSEARLTPGRPRANSTRPIHGHGGVSGVPYLARRLSATSAASYRPSSIEGPEQGLHRFLAAVFWVRGLSAARFRRDSSASSRTAAAALRCLRAGGVDARAPSAHFSMTQLVELFAPGDVGTGTHERSSICRRRAAGSASRRRAGRSSPSPPERGLAGAARS